jgi:hypothetical protein
LLVESLQGGQAGGARFDVAGNEFARFRNESAGGEG